MVNPRRNEILKKARDLCGMLDEDVIDEVSQVNKGAGDLVARSEMRRCSECKFAIMLVNVHLDVVLEFLILRNCSVGIVLFAVYTVHGLTGSGRYGNRHSDIIIEQTCFEWDWFSASSEAMRHPIFLSLDPAIKAVPSSCQRC
jgi:hypothetical protein